LPRIAFLKLENWGVTIIRAKRNFSRKSFSPRSVEERRFSAA
jgi:hypothetical protein